MTDDLQQNSAENSGQPEPEQPKRNRPRGKPFVKGDPRINRKGVPPEAIAARKFVQQIGAELIKLPDKKDEKTGTVIPGEEMTRYYGMIRRMFSSNNPADRSMLIKMMHPGMLKDQVDVTTDGKPLIPKPEEMKPSEIAERVAALLKIKDANGS